MIISVIILVLVVGGGSGLAVAYYVRYRNLKAVSEARVRMDDVDELSADSASKRMRDGNF